MKDFDKQKVDNAPREHKDIRESIKKGLIIVNTGDGKGKSTAAFGTALRAIGRGKRVAIVQFIKGKWKTGEESFFSKYRDLCDFFPMGDGFTWDTKDFAKDVETSRKIWGKCLEVLHNDSYFLVIFDEINYALKYNFLDTQEVVNELKRKPYNKHVILTGNYAQRELIDCADLVSEIKAVKHPYEQGIKAQRGIDF